MSLKTIVRQAWRVPLPFVFSVRSRTVANTLSMTLVEGRAVSDVVRAKKRAFQIGSQQRSTPQFRLACELVRNGRIGKLHTVKIGLPVDPAGGDATVLLEDRPEPGELLGRSVASRRLVDGEEHAGSDRVDTTLALETGKSAPADFLLTA